MSKLDTMSWNTDTYYALGYYRTLTQIIGIWPREHRNWLSITQVTLGSFIQILMIIIYIKDLITKENCGLIIDVVDLLSVVSASFTTIAKLIFPCIHRKRLYLIVNSAVGDWESSDTDNESRYTMRKYAFSGRIVCIIQMSVTYITLVPMILWNLPSFSLSSNDLNSNGSLLFRSIPIGPNCWIPPTMSIYSYLAYYSLVILHTFMMCTSYMSGDVFIFGIAMHICGQLEILYNRMTKLGNKLNYYDQRYELSQVSERHCHLLQLANEFEKTFNLVILVQVAANTFVLCVSGVLILWGLKIGDFEVVSLSIIRIYLMYIQLYMYSYIGEHLSAKFEKFRFAVYNCVWYEMSPLIVRDLTFIILRNNFPFYLTAGKIYQMNMVNFKELVKTIFSYFSVLRLMFDE